MLAFLLLVAAPIVSQIATGGYHSCAVTSEGGVQCWGYNTEGQLGNGTFSSSALAGPVTGLTSGVVSVSTGNWHSCALLTTGAVKCWGANGTGQLGNGSSVRSSTPVNVSGLGGGVAAIAGGKDHTCALLSNGGVKCWGYNGQGQLGTGTNVTYYVPTEVAGLSGGVVSVVTGLSHSCALLTTGGVKCWGYNSNGQLGNGTQTLERSPGDVLGLTSGVTALGAGAYHTCALLSTGGMKCWGHNGTGQLGDGSYNPSTAPVSVAGLGGTAVGLSLGNSHTCALLATSGLQCWGYNFFGQLGTGNFTNRVVPTGVTGLASGVVGVSAGSYFTCAINDVGAVKCWGDDGYGQLGDGAAVKSNVPVQVLGLTGVDPAMTAQILSFTPPASLTVGGTVGLTATADSGLPVSFETWTAGTCSVSGATVTALGNGLCGIRASQAGDGTRAPAPSVRSLIPVSGSPALTISDVTVTESSVASVNATFSVTLSPASAQTVTVQASTVGASAASGVDFSPVFPTTLTFSPGSTVALVTVPVAPDVLDEADETFIAALGTPVNATIAVGLGTGTIVDDDPAPTLSIQDVTVTEGNLGTVNALFNVTLSAVSGKTVTVSAATSNGTATAGSDYVAAGPTTLTFNPGETTKTFSVTVNGDKLSEANETFTVGLSSASNASIFDASGLGTIADDDAVPAISINDVTVTEGNSGTTTASFTVSLSAASGQTVTVAAATSDGTALAGSDYVAAGPTTLTFAPGDTTKLFSVTVSGDTVDEPNETFAVALFSGSNATISDASGLGLIADDDAAPTLSINDVTVAEGNSGTTTASFTVSLSAASGQTVTVAAATADGTALAGSDYVAAGPATLTFAPGDTAKTFSVTVSGDAVDESNETFTVALFSGSNATISDASGLGTILDDDVAPAVSIGTATLITKNSARLNATVNPNGSATSAHFQYGLTDAYGLTTPSEALGSGVSALALDLGSVGGLACGTTYHFRATATGAVSTTNGVDSTFTTTACGPAIYSFTASNVVVNGGDPSLLSWSVESGATLTLNGSPVTGPSGSQTVNPMATTNYILAGTDSSGTSTRSVTVVVNDGSAGVGRPTITAPTSGQSVIVTGIGFTWTAVPSATAYDIRVFNGTTGALLFSGSLLGGNSTSTLVTLDSGAYRFAVRACANGLAPSQCGSYATVEFSVSPAAPSGAPAVTFPTAGANLTQSTQALAWTAVTPNPLLSGLTYELLLSNLTSGTTALQITVPSPATSTIFTMPGGQYELKVRACQAACGPWSTSVNFTVTLPTIPASAPVISACTISGGNSLTCNWGSVANADTYRVLVVQPPPAGPGGGALTAAAVQVSATNVTLPVPPGPATVLIAACNGDGCGAYATSPIDVAGLNPGSPNLGTPMAGTVVSGPTVLFTWNRIPGDNGSNTTYRLFVQDLSRQQTALDIYTTSNFYGAYFRAEGARYDALVIANPGPSQIVGPAQGFNVAGLSATAPTMVSPAHNSTVPSGNVQLGWSPVPGATLYEYFVAVLGQPDATARGVTPGLLTQVPLTGSGLGTVYSGIVRACPLGATCVAGVDAGWGPWSNAGGPGVTNFTVIP